MSSVTGVFVCAVAAVALSPVVSASTTAVRNRVMIVSVRSICDNRHRAAPRPARTRYLHREHRHLEPERPRQLVQVRQLLDVAVLALAAHAVRGQERLGIAVLEVLA